MGTRGIRAGAVALLALGLIAGSAGAATKSPSKVGKLKSRSATTTGSGNGTIISATAVCPKGSRAVGGGFLVQPAFGLDVQPVVFESARAGGRSWRASAQIGDASAPPETATLTSSVNCRKGAPKLSASSATVPAPAAASSTVGPTAQASCAAGKKALAGGFASNPPFPPGSAAAGILVTDSYRSSKSSWTTRVMRGGPADGSLTAHAYCAKAKALKAVTVQGNTAPGNFQSVSALASCPGRPRAQAGGFTQNAAVPFGLIIVYLSQGTGTDWQVQGVHLGTNPGALTAVAYCG